jgi:CBS domain-containing protein
MMKVADILAVKGPAVVTIKPSDTIAALSQRLHEKRIGAAIVSSDGQHFEGVISERDIAYGLSVHKGNLHAMPVSALMTKAVITCSPQDTVASVASTMLSRNIRHLPVEQDKRLIGVISMRDVLNTRLDELQRQASMLRAFASSTDITPQDR